MAETLEKIDPVVFVATRRGIVALEGLEGELLVLPHGLYATAVECLVTDGKGVLLAAGTRERGVMWSLDGGKSFAPASGIEGRVQAMAAAGGVVFAASAAGLWKSEDAARSFQRAAMEARGAITALLLSGQRLCVATEAGSVFVSEDLGSAFRQAGAAVPAPATCLAAAAGDGVLVASAEGIYRSTRPGTEAWKRLWSDHERPAVTAVAAMPSGGIVCGVARSLGGAKPGDPAGADAALFASADGLAWAQARVIAMPVIRGRIGVIVCSSRTVFAGTTSGEVFASEDGGQTYRLAASTLPGALGIALGPAAR